MLFDKFKTMADFQAGVVEEASPIMFWPGHFDLAMMWLPGEKIPGRLYVLSHFFSY